MKTPTRLNQTEAILNSIEAILVGGTKIVSFRTPSGWHANVLIGSNKVRDHLSQYKLIRHNKAVVRNAGGGFTLYGLENNIKVGTRPIMAWNIANITEFSALDTAHFYKPAPVSAWKRAKQFIVRNVLKIFG